MASRLVLRSTRDVDVFLFAGQSNMIGNNTTSSDLASWPYLLVSDPHIIIYNWEAAALQTLSNGVNNNNNDDTVGQWGAEAQFSYAWRQDNPSKKFFFVKSALGGTYLSADVFPSWNAGHTAEYFDTFTGNVNAAKSAIIALGFNPKVRALCWMQGESDATSSLYATPYGANLSAFITKVRTDWGDANTRIIVGRIATAAGSDSATVRSGEAAAVSGTTLAALVDTDSYGLIGIHYDAAGNISMGADMYAAYKAL